MWAWLTSIGRITIFNTKRFSLPRELSLSTDGILRIAPLRELEKQRYDEVTLNDLTITNPVTGMFGTVPPTEAPALQRIAELETYTCEIRIIIPHKEALRKQFGFVLFADADRCGLSIMLRPETATLHIGETDAPFAVANLPHDEDVELRIFVDKYLVEVFANDRQAVVAAHMDYSGKTGLYAFTVGAPTTLASLEMWKLKPTNEGFLEAQANHIWEPDTQ